MQIKKLINSPDTVVDEALTGLALAYADLLGIDGRMIISKSLPDADRVTLVAYGGAGYGPISACYVGEGCLDIQVVGDVFAAPNPTKIYEAIVKADKGQGVLLLNLNNPGELLAGQIAVKMAEKAGTKVKHIVVRDNITDAPRTEAEERRGLAGAMPLYHIVAAAAREDKNLEEVAALAQFYADNMATVSVVTAFGTHPQTGAPLGEIPDGYMLSGNDMIAARSAQETVTYMLETLLRDISVTAGDKVFVMVNGYGATTTMEQFVIYKDCVEYLQDRNIEVVACMVGEIMTQQEQAGFQLHLAKWNGEILRLWQTAAQTPGFVKA